MPNLNIVILEKSKGTGGRMCTSRSSFGSTVDLGAQFITKSSNLTSTQEKLYNHLFDEGILQPMPENVEGLRSLPYAWAHFIAIRDQESTLDGLMPHVARDQIEKLKAVKYCSRYALGFFYDSESSFFKDISWCAKFINDDIIRYCAVDVHKRKGTGLPSVVFHTSKEFGALYIDENADAVQDLIVKRIEHLFPQMPKPNEIKFQKWRYSQAKKIYCEKQACLVASNKPLLIFGGDGFSNSNFENCVLSAENIAQKIIETVS
ncbi:Renalase like protein [Argiope bruennichi]|uniref:Renalase like protein n=1 Tax=Argiope bruennichi TaxID=94029 RepID=A0A8T0EZ54_ARGBR|nr:Renalase like protein [Argiope bruennichi]